MTRDEFEQTCKDVCPHCAAGAVVRQRTDTLEHVHDFANPDIRFKSQGHAFCLASHFRNKHKDNLDG